jgi:ABC-2 type transport system permease protein
MRADTTRLELRLRRRSLVGYALGMALYALIVVTLYPSFKDDAGLNKLTENGNTVAALFGATGSLNSPSGWLSANLYANFVPLIVLLLAIGYGAASIAGQDEDGTLGLLATLPLSRRRLVAEKFAAMCLQPAPVALVTMLCVLAGPRFELHIGVGNLIAATVGVLLLAIDFGALAMLVGAVTGSRGAALGIASTVAAASYITSSLAPVVHWIHPFRLASPFFYAVGDGQLARGLSAGGVAVLVGIAVVFGLASIAAFERLDIH